MPSPRRLRILIVAVATVILLYLVFNTNQKFYRSTVDAMEARHAAATTAKEISTAQRNLKSEAAQAQEIDTKGKDLSVAKAAGTTGDDEMEEIPIAGRTKMQVPKRKGESSKVAVKKPDKEQEQKDEGPKQESQDHAEARAELEMILKRAPVIIFSKSYCPYSAKAKHILLDRYSIVPAPYVVELDLHPLGRDLQTVLGQVTGRHTVPNVMVAGKSIGGGDDMVALDGTDELASKLNTLGGNWVVEATRKQPVES